MLAWASPTAATEVPIPSAWYAAVGLTVPTLDAGACGYDYRADFARQPPLGVGSFAHDTLTELADPAAVAGEELRAFCRRRKDLR